MRYTSWDRTDKQRPRLVADEEERLLAVAHGETLLVGDDVWQASTDSDLGSSLTTPDGRQFQAFGKLKKDPTIQLSLAGKSLTIVAESSKEFVVEDTTGAKVAQFTSANHGVRRGIVEYEPESTITDEEAIVLGHFSRIMLEERLSSMSVALIGTLALLTVAAVVTVLI